MSAFYRIAQNRKAEKLWAKIMPLGIIGR